MSSTKRGKSRQRADNYPTPYWCVHRVLEAIELPMRGRWLEPCAGDGAIIRAIEPMEGSEAIEWTAVELRKGPLKKLDASSPNVEVVQGNFLTMPGYDDNNFYDVAITNPPFLHAMAFVNRCRHLARDTVMLLRLNFLASEKRADFMRETRPDIYVLPNRPSFIGGGKTDSIEYAWFHWWRGSEGHVRILNSTHKLERGGR